MTLVTTPRKLNGVLFGSGKIAPDGVVIDDRQNDLNIPFVSFRIGLPRNKVITRCNIILFSSGLFSVTANRASPPESGIRELG